MRGLAISLPQSTVGGGDLRPAWGQGDRGVSRGGPAASVSPLLSLCLGGCREVPARPGSGRPLSGITRQLPFPPGLLPRMPLPHPRRALCGGPRQSGSSLPALLPVPASACRASSAPLTWDLTAARSGPSSPPAPPGPPLPPEAFLVPAAAAPHCWSPRNQLPWGHRPRGDAGPGGTFSSFGCGDTWNSPFPWIRPRGGLRAGPDTSRGQAVRRALRGKGCEPWNQPGKGSREASRCLGAGGQRRSVLETVPGWAAPPGSSEQG